LFFKIFGKFSKIFPYGGLASYEVQIEIFFADIFFVMFNEMRKILFDQFKIRPTMCTFIGSWKTIPALVVASVAEE
jgi:hypothetical protein